MTLNENGMTFTECFKEVKERLTIPEVWRILGLPGLVRKKCCSPFRDETRASFSISKEGRYWKDHGTGEGGDVFDFYQKATGLTKAEVHNALFELCHLTPKKETLYAKPVKPKMLYCKVRSIETPSENYLSKLPEDGVLFLNWKDIHLYTINRLMAEGSVDIESDKMVYVYNTGRKMRCDWWNSGSTIWLSGNADGALWRYNQVLQPDIETVIICEGETDLMRAMSVIEIPDHVALVSAPAASWRPDPILCRTIGNGRNIVLAFDYDQAGIAASTNVGQLLNEHGGCNQVRSFPWKQIDELGELYSAKDLCTLRKNILQKTLDDCFNMR